MYYCFFFQKYEEKASKAKDDYNKAMKEFKESGGGVESNKKSSKKASVKSPKKPISSPKKVSLPTKSGSFISKEFIESDDDSSLSEDNDKNKKKTKSKKVSF